MKATEENDGNAYDKILRENAMELFLPLIQDHLPSRINSFRALPEDLQSTMEWEADAVFDVLLEDGSACIIHIEFETKSNHQMIYRFVEYHGILQKRYKKPVHHFLIYIGRWRTRMPSKLPDDQVFRGFTLLDLGRFDPQEMLSSQVPEVLILAILSGYPKEQIEEILRSLLRNLTKSVKDPGLLNKYIAHLVTLSKLRKADEIVVQLINEVTMPLNINIKDHALYKEGRQEGRQEGIDQEFERRTIEIILTGYRNGATPEFLALQTGWPLKKVRAVISSGGVRREL